MIFQHFNLLEQQTVLENVCFPLEIRKVPAKLRKEKAMELLEKVGLAEKAHAYPSQLSGGQKQRVAIARALVTEAKVLLADEPTGALDYSTGQELMKIFQEIHKQGTTIVLVTHDRNIAEQTNRIITIQDSEIVGDEQVKKG